MRRSLFWINGLAAGLLLLAAPALQAQDAADTLTGNLLFGYRMVDTSGADSKYREDINLDDGIRLFNFDLHLTPENQLKNLFDRLDLNVYNYGGDPYESLGLTVQKFGRYKFQYLRRKSAYFYQDQQEIGGGHLYDLHTFDFERLTDGGFLKVRLNRNIELFLNFDRYTKQGDSVTTFDINRIEFEYDRPIREESKEIALGFNLQFKGYSLVFEEKLLDYSNSNSLFLPGYADGGSGAAYPSSLDFMTLEQPYDLKAATHTFKVNARPYSGLLVTGSAMLSNQDLDLSSSEQAAGIDYLNRFFTFSSSGEGAFERNFQLFDLDATWLLFDRLAVIGAVRYHDFEQTGSLTLDGAGTDSERGYNTLGIEGGLQFQATAALAVTAGYRNEQRELVGWETTTFEQETRRNGVFGNLNWSPSKAFKLTADYQYGNYDDPYTLISPTGFTRFRATTRINTQGFSLNASFLRNATRSEVYEDIWESIKNQVNLRAGYQTDTLRLFAGYALIDVQHEGDRLVGYPPSWSGPAGTFLWEIFYEGKSHLMDAALAFDLSPDWHLAAYASRYTNAGFWEISRTMLKAHLEYVFAGGYVARVGYRFVDFEESLSGFNDYSANILEFAFGYRWR